MAVAIIYFLEAVQIDIQQAHHAASTAGVTQFLFEPVTKQHAVGQIGK